MEFQPGIHQVFGLVVNSYLIEDDDGLTLIDAGVSAKKVLRYLGRMGREPSDIVRIIVTHADPDHMGGLADLKAESGARVYASPLEASAIARGTLSRQLKPGPVARMFELLMSRVTLKPAVVDELLGDGQVLPVLGGLWVVYTPGHTPGHVSLYAPSVGVLFCGDSMVAPPLSRMVCSRGANTWDEGKALASVEVQRRLGARIVCAGHGLVVRDADGRFPRPGT